MYNLITLLSIDIVGGGTPPLEETYGKDYTGFGWAVGAAIFAIIAVIALIITLVIGHKKKIWEKHSALQILTIIGIIIFAIIGIIFTFVCIVFVVN